MSDSRKPLCKWKKADIEAQFDELVALVRKPKYICSKCGRAAKSKKSLCKPESLK
jgi:hypothetical protein